MSISQLLAIFAVFCLLASAFLARRHLCERGGLQIIFAGLLLAGAAGILISFPSSAIAARWLSMPMLAGMGLVVVGIHVERRTKGQIRPITVS